MDFSKHMGITYGDYHGLPILWGVCWRNIRITYPFKMSTLQQIGVACDMFSRCWDTNPMWDLKFWGFPKSSEINLQKKNHKNPTFEKEILHQLIDMAVNIPLCTGFHTSQIVPSGAGFLPSTVSCLLTFLFVKMLKQFWSSARFPRKNGVESVNPLGLPPVCQDFRDVATVPWIHRRKCVVHCRVDF